ncbi:ABC transporter substrate-binding protein [Cellulomonas composti]|uniref:Sugar ABC transporter substrate-binding protein n=1 Tax=Cellulomonas composti TaxID=266130 RepID=A0A511JC29_9CELL|nr:extracellular solute-binding protein [Cellulomonas composti]GEL95528.1 sugar ABC transporter substrate-binding protein [Cellulomonas composti]
MARMRRATAAFALATTVALLAAACSSGDDNEPGTDSTTTSGGGDKDVTITWWHNSNTGDGKTYYDKVAADFEAANPGVTIDVNAMQHEDMVTKLEAAFQAGDAPDVYMERGGGELADHVAAGLTKDISDSAADTIAKLGGSVGGFQVDGKTYALPFSLGVVGFWYNKALFEQAGITDVPTSWDDMYDVIDTLKGAGIEPISVGAGDKWPAAHYWYYFSLRECSEDTLKGAVTSLDFSDPCFVKAGEDLEKLIAAEPFNAGFLTTPAQTGATSASGLLATGKVAIEMQGHWEPGVMQGLTEDGLGLGENTGWFAFPSVDDGEGDPADALGGGDAWAVGANAPDEAVEFAKYLLSDEVQKGFAELDMGLPTNNTASQYVSDPALATLLDVRDKAPYVQLYFDTAFGSAIGGAMNDEIALMFAGQASPQDIVDATQAAADAEK